MLFDLDTSVLISAFLIGLLGGGHCIGMCGGIMSALSFAVPQDQPRRRNIILVTYSLGRVLSYTLIGFIFGFAGQLLAGNGGLPVLRWLAGLLLIAMGLYIGGWWMGLTYLERAGGFLWRYVQPLANRLMPVKTPTTALFLGVLWGWLPCGLVYSSLGYAVSQGSALGAAAVMLAFGLGTLPAVLSGTIFAAFIGTLFKRPNLRKIMALLLIVFGGWTIWIAQQHAGHAHHHSGHGEPLNSEAEQQSNDQQNQHNHHEHNHHEHHHH